MKNDLFLRACRGERTDRVPVWFMRQAGRSLPEYRELRDRYSILELCGTPDLAVEITLQPVGRHGTDAAILFSDIVVPLQAMGVDLDIKEGVGPIVYDPIRMSSDVDKLRPLHPEEDVPFVLDAVRALVSELDVPLIGFAGAPFTLASYLVDGGPSKDHALTKALMYSDPKTWHRLMEVLAAAVLAYLRAQLAAGASAIQLFDSWVGNLSRIDFQTFAEPYVRHIMSGLEDLGAPRIYFGIHTGHLLERFAAVGADVAGIDSTVPLDDARALIGDSVALQGNLDPAVCLGSWEVVEGRALDVLRRGGGRGHVFNLGHGVHRDTDPGTLTRLVELVHEWDPGG